jgi:AraC-like DNA-binding protein
MTESKRLLNSGACVWPAALIVWGPGSAPGRHSHHCAQLQVALTGTLRVRSRVGEPWRRCRAVVVKPNADHEIDGTGAFVVIGFVGAESLLGKAIVGRTRSTIGIVSDADAARWRSALGDAPMLNAARVERWMASTLIGGNGHASRVHPGVQGVVRMLSRHSLDSRTTSLAALSKLAGLSPSRFAHVFTESIGVPLRPYKRWLRLQRAARELVMGRTVTQAAHVAGFADAAHLTRTFRRTLGATPRELIQRAATHDRRDG